MPLPTIRAAMARIGRPTVSGNVARIADTARHSLSSLNLPRLIVAGALFWGGAAVAQQQCGPRGAVIKTLADKYAETRQAIGISANNLVMEVYAGASGTWTITVTTPRGMTCLVASGQAFEAVTEALPPQGVPG